MNDAYTRDPERAVELPPPVCPKCEAPGQVECTVLPRVSKILYYCSSCGQGWSGPYPPEVIYE